MEKRIYVVGHRNPDTDSVASAIACAELKRRLGWGDAVAAVAGEVNPQTRYILERLGMEPPLYLADVHPKVRDVVISRPVCATADMPLRDALQLFHTHKIRVLPVVDESNRPLGIVSLLKLSEKYLVAGTDRRRVVDATFRSIATCLDGTFLSGGPSDEPQHLRLFIGAMAEESFNEGIAGHEISSLMVMTGNRPTIQAAAIELGVRLLVLTGGYPVDELLLEKARRRFRIQSRA